MMEGYILHGRNIAESCFKEKFAKVNGGKGLEEFEAAFRSNFITEKDFENISSWGFNTVRLPFNHKLIETPNKKFNTGGLAYLKKAFEWAEKNGIKIILDMHAAPGAQNCDWHGDCAGKALFWEDTALRKRAVELWEFLSDTFKGEEALLGYDILNEPVTSSRNEKIILSFYKDAIKKIKRIDNRHTIFIEGNSWAQNIDFLEDAVEENVSVSVHFYHPISYVFNFTPFLSFPGKIEGQWWDENEVRKELERYYEFSVRNKVSIFLGEFGINWRGRNFGETRWLEAVLKAVDEYGFGYSYWTYKAVANGVFPDGLFQSVPNGEFIKREGPLFGWENYIDQWKERKRGMIDFWKTENFTPNRNLIEVIKRYNLKRDKNG